MPTIIPLSTHIRPNPSYDPKTKRRSNREKLINIPLTREIKNTRGDLMIIPEKVGGNGIKTSPHKLKKPIPPQTPRNPSIVDLTAQDHLENLKILFNTPAYIERLIMLIYIYLEERL
jgi:hypothetical protein